MRKPGNVKQEFATLLALVAKAGTPDDPGEAQRAYLAGMQRVLPRDHVPYAPPPNGVLALDAVWEPLAARDPLAQREMVEAIPAAVRHDGRGSRGGETGEAAGRDRGSKKGKITGGGLDI